MNACPARGPSGRARGRSMSRACPALQQLVDGVLALHAAGILHRDLKPSNVLVTHAGHVVILDFGLAATTTELAPTGNDGRFGPPAYMSPEQARGGALTMASDWYAIGVMLYEALAGQLPFSGSSSDMLAARLNRDVRDPRSLRADLPDLAALALALLHRNPTARPNGFQIARLLDLDPQSADGPRHVLGGAFVGRTDQLSSLRQAFELARTGRTVVAHVHGPSGYGKTTLVRRFLSSLSLEHEVGALLRAGLRAVQGPRRLGGRARSLASPPPRKAPRPQASGSETVAARGSARRHIAGAGAEVSGFSAPRTGLPEWRARSVVAVERRRSSSTAGRGAELARVARWARRGDEGSGQPESGR
jgi:hypothetical protein